MYKALFKSDVMRCGYYILFTLLSAVISTQNTSISSGEYQPVTDLTNSTSVCPAWTIPDQSPTWITHNQQTPCDQTHSKCARSIYYNEAIVCIAVNGSRPQAFLLDGFWITQNKE